MAASQVDPCCTTKAVDPAWFEGQAIEEPAVRALVPAFGRYVRTLWAAIDEILAALEDNPHLDVIAALGALPWMAANDHLIGPWEQVAARAHAAAGIDQVRKVTDAEVRRFSVEWAQVHALELAQVTTLGSRAAIDQAIVDAIRNNVPPIVLARRVRDSVGLTASNAAAMEALRQRLTVQGVAPARVDREVKRFAGRARRSRAETIARTELNRARSLGTLSTWSQQQVEGILPDTVLKIWIANPGCKICVTIAAQGGIPINSTWVHPVTGALIPAPPAHPRCRCSPALEFP